MNYITKNRQYKISQILGKENVFIEQNPQFLEIKRHIENNILNNIVFVDNSKYPDIIFYGKSRNDIFIRYDKKEKIIVFDYLSIWFPFTRKFNINNDVEISAILLGIANTYFKLPALKTKPWLNRSTINLNTEPVDVSWIEELMNE